MDSVEIGELIGQMQGGLKYKDLAWFEKESLRVYLGYKTDEEVKEELTGVYNVKIED